MSLTSEINKGASWVNRFFKHRFPGVVDFAKREGVAVKKLNTRIPVQSKATARLVGTAFDYRLRMCFQNDLANSTMISIGVLKLLARGSGLGAAVDQRWADATTELLCAPPARKPDLMARASVVLAWLDWGFRSGGKWSDGLRAVARSCAETGARDWESYTLATSGPAADEVAAIMRITEVPPAQSVTCGASFNGSRFVGGADADLILDRRLYDVKCTLEPRKELPRNVRQLIGYALLDWNDDYELLEVGFYFARQGEWISWPLPSLIQQTTGDGTATLAGIRKEFEAVALQHSPLAALPRARRRMGNRLRTD